MKSLGCAVLLTAMLLHGCAGEASTTRQLSSGWQLYSNYKYGYEIAYPEGYGLWETGVEGNRDGATLRIGWLEYEALTPMLDVRVEPRTAANEFAVLGMQAQDLSLSVEDIVLNGQPARQAVYRWRESGKLALVEINSQGVLFRFQASPATGEFEGTEWQQIISTFRFTR